MKIRIALASVERDRAMEAVARRVIDYLSSSLGQVLRNRSKEQAIRFFEDWWEHGGKERVELSNISWRGLKLPQKYLNFLRRHKMPVKIQLVDEDSTTRGTYYPDQPAMLRNIEINIKPSELYDNMNDWGVRSMLNDHFSTIVHEFTHAYDDYASKGKYQHNKRSVDNQQASRLKKHGNEYLRDPIEINARYSGAVAKLGHSLPATFKEYLYKFKQEFAGWEKIPPREQKRLTKRLGADFTSKLRKKNPDKTQAVNRFQQKLNSLKSPVTLAYYHESQVLRIHTYLEEGRDTTHDVPPFLPMLTKFADTHRLILTAYLGSTKSRKKADKHLQDRFKEYGFVPNRGRTKNYAISDTFWRPSKR